MPSPPTSTVAELFAILGVDITPLDQGLRKAEIRLEDSARKQIISIKSVSDIYRAFPADVIDPMIQAWTKAGVTSAQANKDIMAGLGLLQEEKRRVEALTAAKAADRRETIAVQDIRTRLNNEIIKQNELGEKAAAREASLASKIPYEARIIQRILGFSAAYGAARFAQEAVFNRPIDIQRQSSQTGFNVEDVQRLQFAAAATGTTVETAVSSIARLQERVGAMAPKTRAALDSLGLGAQEFQRRLESGPLQAAILLAQRIEGLGTAAEKQAAIQDLFGGRTGEVSGLLKSLANDQIRSVVLSEQQVEAVAKVAKAWHVAYLEAQGYFALIVAHVMDTAQSGKWSDLIPISGGAIAGASLGAKLPGTPLTKGIAAAVGGGIGAMVGDVELQRWQKTFGGPQPPPLPSAPVMPIPGGLPSLDLVKGQQSTIESNLNRQHRDILRAQAEEQRAQRDLQRELAKTKTAAEEFDDALRQMWDDLKHTSQGAQESLTEYFDALEKQAAGPGIQQAITMFEQGRISANDLLIYRRMANSRGPLGEAEKAFREGGGSPGDIARQHQYYLEELQRSNPNAFMGGPQGSTTGSILGPTRLANPRGPWVSDRQVGTGQIINVVPMDQLSERMVRKWKQQGLQTR